MVKAVARSREAAWSARDRDAAVLAKRSAAEFRKVVQIEIHVIRNVQVQQPVAVVVAESGTRAPASRISNTRLRRHVAKCSITIVLIKEGAGETRNIKVVPAIVVVIPYRRSKAPAAVRQTSLLCHVGKCAVMVVVVELARGTLSRLHVLESGTVDQIDIRPAIVVVIEEGDPATHRFHDVELLCTTAGQAKVDAGAARHIHERRRRRRLPLDAGGRKQQS